MKTKDYENLKAFLIRKKIDIFWINSALHHIRLGSVGNCFWTADFKGPRVSVDKTFKCIRRLSIACNIGTVNGSIAGHLVYIYTPGKGHKVNVKAN